MIWARSKFSGRNLNQIFVEASKSFTRFGLLVCLCALLTGCSQLSVNPIASRFQPSNDRDWKPEQANAPFAEVNGSNYLLHNIRNCSYLTADDYVVDYQDRQIDLSQIQTVDFVVVPFKAAPALAHTMLSFGLDDGTYLSVSVEVRKEKGERYNPLAGLTGKFELIYVMGNERDLIRLRTKHYDSSVYIYPTLATTQQAQALFVDIVRRMNQLISDPEFYHTVANNCTTNIRDHVNGLSPDRIAYGWRVLLPGFSAKHAYELGLLDNRIPFEDLETIAFVNDLAEEHFEHPDFSQLIRSDRYMIDRYLLRQENREPVMRSRGEAYLEQNATRNRLGNRRLLRRR